MDTMSVSQSSSGRVHIHVGDRQACTSPDLPYTLAQFLEVWISVIQLPCCSKHTQGGFFFSQ